MPIAARAKQRVRILVLAILVLNMVGLAAATLSAWHSSFGPTSTPNADARKVTVVGAGQVQGAPDTLTVNTSIEAAAPDVTAAMNQTSERQAAVIKALVDAGIDRKDISTTQVNLQPQYSAGDSTAIVGYRASNSIDVKIRKLDSASQTLALIVSTGGDASRINSVNYTIEDDSQLVKDARTRAFNDAKDRATQYAQLSGLDLGKVISISESAGSPPPTPLPGTRAAEMAAVPLEPGQQTVKFSVTVVWELT
jgi:uncharacterized protein YggE